MVNILSSIMSQSEGPWYKTSAIASTTDWNELDKEWAPIMAELVTLEPGNNQDPVVMKLFNWLVEPQRTGKEFSYVIGELAENMNLIMEKHFLKYVYNDMFCTYLCTIAGEALAVRCPILEGPWEQAAWTLLVVIDNRYGYPENEPENDYSVVSNYFGPWIIRVIGDPGLCPNPYLRFELILVLFKMVDLNNCNPTQVIGSVLSACSCLSSEYLSVNILEYHQTHSIDSVLSAKESLKTNYLSTKLLKFRKFRDIDDLYELTNVFEAFAADGRLLEFDKMLAGQLLEVKASRCSVMIHDVSYRYSLNPSRYAEPRELYGLIALIKTVAGTVEMISKELQIESYDGLSILRRLGHTSNFLHLLLTNFKASCETPQLVCLTLSCLKDFRKILNQIKDDHIGIDDISIYRHIEWEINQLLPVL